MYDWIDMKRLLLLFIGILLCCSCGVDSAKIIGKEFESSSLPYGEGYHWYGYKNIGDTRNKVIAVYYNNKVIVYIINENEELSDYFFSEPVNFQKARKTPLGTNHEIVKRKFGEPVFHSFRSDYDDRISKDSQLNDFSYTYLQKTKKSLFSPYELSPVIVEFAFDSLGKLENIIIKYAAP
jgi:hypothetical protein